MNFKYFQSQKWMLQTSRADKYIKAIHKGLVTCLQEMVLLSKMLWINVLKMLVFEIEISADSASFLMF